MADYRTVGEEMGEEKQRAKHTSGRERGVVSLNGLNY